MVERKAISTKRIGQITLEFGKLGQCWYIGIRYAPMRKPKLRLFTNREIAIAYGKKLDATFSKPVKVIREIQHYGRITKRGEWFIVELRRNSYRRHILLVQFFHDRRAAEQYFLEQRDPEQSREAVAS